MGVGQVLSDLAGRCFEKRCERHEASEEPRNVRLYMSSDERRFVARGSFPTKSGYNVRVHDSLGRYDRAPRTSGLRQAQAAFFSIVTV